MAAVLFGRPTVTLDVMTDVELVKRAKEGDLEAFSELTCRHQHNVYNLSMRFMRDSASAEDMAQEAFLKAFRMLHGFRGDASFSTWMYRVTSSVCLTELKRRKRRGEVELTPTHEQRLKADPELPKDVADIIRRCVSELPDRYAEIITMYYLGETSYDEIAKGMGVPLGTLKTWMHRARKQLRTIVEKHLTKEELDVLF
jgi:RNA polymerase sigma-70 factor (ECF subfamily)